MTSEIFVLLGQDGVTNGAIYALLALSLVLVYSVTRIVFVPQGEFVTYGAMTLASIQFGGVPGTLWILCGLSTVVAALECISMLRLRRLSGLPRTLAVYLLAPGALAALCWLAPLKTFPLPIQALLTVAILVGGAQDFFERLARHAVAEALEIVLETGLVGRTAEQRLVTVRDERAIVHQYL